MKYLIILLFPFTIQAQSVSVSLPSFDFWGSQKMISQVSVEYKNVGLHYFHAFGKPQPYLQGDRTSTFGISYTPIDFKYVKIGGIATHKPFPTLDSVQVNFIVDAGFNIGHVRLSYQHISNGFGLRHSINHGYDTITIRIAL